MSLLMKKQSSLLMDAFMQTPQITSLLRSFLHCVYKSLKLEFLLKQSCWCRMLEHICLMPCGWHSSHDQLLVLQQSIFQRIIFANPIEVYKQSIYLND